MYVQANTLNANNYQNILFKLKYLKSIYGQLESIGHNYHFMYGM